MTAAQRRAVSGILTGILAVGVTPGASAADMRRTAGWGYPQAAGPTAYTLPTDAGTYTVTGSDASLRSGHVLPTVAGAYSVAGSAASLLQGYGLNGTPPGAYTLTGTAASLLRSRVLPTEAGAYTLTGSAASLLRGRVLVTEAGAYVVTGSEAALLRGRVLVTDAGAYLLTGSDALMLRGPAPMVAEPGAYLLTGSEAGLVAGRVLLTDAGAYLLTGTDAALERVVPGRVLTTEAGAYLLAGSEAALVVTAAGDITLVTDVGAYLLAGVPADLTYAATPPPFVTREVLVRRLRRSPVINDESRWIFHHAIQIDLETGVGLVTGEGSDPQLMLRWSDDGGVTWSSEHWMPDGRMGQYQTRAVWMRLGRARDRVYETTVTSPVAWHLLACLLHLEPGIS